MRCLPLLVLLCLAGLALAQGAANASCQGTVNHLVPAVVGTQGGLVNLSVTLVPPQAGQSGSVYAGVYPSLGVSTEESIDQAVTYAFTALGRGVDCDVLVSFTTPSGTTYIDGPSAGTSISVMTYAALQNRTPRNDTIITGAIGDMGTVDPVGGLYEKSMSAAEAGATYFITPDEGIYETLILRKAEQQFGIKVLIAHNVSEVADFMLYGTPIPQQGLGSDLVQTPALPAYDTTGIEKFVPVASSMISLENETLASINGTDNDSASIRAFFQNEMVQQERMEQEGYLFSAANDAFLDYTDLATIKAILANDTDIPREKGSLATCLSALPEPQITDQNWQWIVGADLRERWAFDKYNTTNSDDTDLEDEKYAKINDLEYGEAWCQVAGSLLAQAPAGGTPIDESAWKQLAAQKIKEATGLQPQHLDSQDKLNTSEESYAAGRYGAAIYDAVYVIVNEQAPPADLRNETEIMLSQTRTSLWGRIYQSHAAFLLGQNETSAAYTTALMARELDAASSTMTDEMAPAAAQGSSPVALSYSSEPSGSGNQLLFLIVWGILSILLLVVAVILIARMTRRADGSDNKGYRGNDRAKQKKG